MNWRFAAFLWAAACFARPFELGGMAGFGVYRNSSVTAAAATATAGFANRFAAGAVFGEDMYGHLSGELRYLYQGGDAVVSAGTMRGSVPVQSHAVHYDFLLEVFDRERRIRPYAIVGGGIKYIRGTGAEPVVQPLPQLVTLAARSQFSALGAAGAGVRYRLADRVYVRADFVDFITPFPSKLFAAAPGAAGGGILHQFTPTIGITFRP